MKTRSEYIQIIRAHAPELQSRFGIQSMSLFGSVARNEQHEGSDVDLFVKMPPKFFNYIEASEYLRNILECDVDLISDHRNLRPFFRKQIERDGINIFTAEGNSQRFVGANHLSAPSSFVHPSSSPTTRYTDISCRGAQGRGQQPWP